MTVELNGRPVELEEGAAVSDAVSRFGAGGAVDGEVVPRAAWEQTRLAEGQRVEVVRAIQGG